MDIARLLGSLAVASSHPRTEVSAAKEIDPANPAATIPEADTYHGTDDPVSKKLLAESGVNAYCTIMNIGEINKKYETAADLLTIGVPRASEKLHKAWIGAMTELSPELKEKDWSFSIHNGNLVIQEHRDELTDEDRKALNDAFTFYGVDVAAAEVADATITSIRLRRESGTPTGTLGWGRFKVDESNFDEIVDMRRWLTSLQPGGKYTIHRVDKRDTSIASFFAGYEMMEIIAARADAYPSKDPTAYVG